jgi:hypothetical protein
MSNGIQDLRSLPLSDIIGAPVCAIVQAEALAARTTMDFIEQVGFVKDPNAPPGSSAFDIGQLRMVEFSYTKPGADGTPVDFVTRVPLLALLPIPGVQIKTAHISFTARITDAYSETVEAQSGVNPLPAGAKPSFLDSPALRLRGGFTSSASAKSSQNTTATYDLMISLDIEHVSSSPGLEKLYNVLDTAISEMPKP